MADANIGKAAVVLSADSKLLNQAFDGAIGKVNAFSSVASKAFAPLAAGVGLMTIFDSLNDTLSQIDNIGDQASALGVGAVAFSRLANAAELSDIEVDALSLSMTMMNKTLGEARLGDKAASESLGKIGLSMKELVDLAPDEQFLKIANALSEVEDQGVKTALALNIFGKGGKGLLAGLGDPGALMKEWEQAGASFSEGLAKQADKWDKDQKRIGQGWKEIKGHAASFMVTYIDTVKGVGGAFEAGKGGNLIEFIKEWRKVGEEPGPKGKVDLLAEEADRLADSLKEQAPASAEAAAQAKLHQLVLAGLNEESANLVRGLLQQREAQAAMLNAERDQLLIEEQLAKLRQQNYARAMPELEGKARLLLGDAASDAAIIEAADLFAQEAGARLKDSLKTSTEKAMDEIAQAEDLFRRGRIDQATFDRVLNKAADAAITRPTFSLPPALEKGTAAERTFNLQQDREEREATKTIPQKLEEARQIQQAQLDEFRRLAPAVLEWFRANANVAVPEVVRLP